MPPKVATAKSNPLGKAKPHGPKKSKSHSSDKTGTTADSPKLDFKPKTRVIKKKQDAPEAAKALPPPPPKVDDKPIGTKKSDGAASQLFVKSNFGNLCGVYKVVPGEGSNGRLSYKNKSGTCLYYLNAGACWAFAPQVQSKSVYLQVKSEAISPLEVPSDAWGDKVETIKQIKAVREGAKAFPARLLVKSNYGNLRGTYERVVGEDCAGRPSYKNKGGVCLYFFEEKCMWVFGPELGGSAFFTGCESDVATPVELSAEAFPEGGISEIRELEEVRADQIPPAPVRIFVKSSFSNLRGVFTLQEGKEIGNHPSYQNKQDVFLYFLEDVNSWLMGPELGGSGAFTKAETDSISPLDIAVDAWANAAVTEIRLLPEVNMKEYYLAPHRLFVKTSYSNLRGVYKRSAGNDCDGRPSYQNSQDVHLYYVEDARSWLFGPKLGGDDAFVRLESDATTPVHHKLENEESIQEIRKMPEIDSQVVATAPGRIAVKSPYGNVTGVYRRVAGKDIGERPSYGNVHGTCLWFCEDICSWVFGQTLGSTQFYCKAESDAPLPLEVLLAAWDGNVDEIWDLGDINEDALQHCPDKLGLDCKYVNIAGGYVRTNEYEGFPAYHNEPQAKYLWHKLAERQWVITDAKPGEKGHYAKGKYMKWDSMVLDPLKLTGQECDFYEVTWRDHERKGFVDPDFPPEAPTLGVDRDHEVQWIRASDLDRELNAVLWNEIKPTNLLQGAVGNCWLLAAFACLAALHPKMLEDLFVTADKVNAEGRYSIRLYSVLASDWENIEIDDFIPCRKREWFEKRAKPIAAHPHKNEIWVLLLEKAFAKFVGSWGALEGGEVSWALQAITGCEACWSFKKKDGEWFRYDNNLSKQKEHIKQGNKRTMAFLGGIERLSASDLFTHIAGGFKQQYLMSCSVLTAEKPPKKSVHTFQRQSKRKSRNESAPFRKSMAQRAGDAVRSIMMFNRSEHEDSGKESLTEKSPAGGASRKSISKKVAEMSQGAADWAKGQSKLLLKDPDKDELDRAQKVRPDGLIDDHAYSVTNIIEHESLRLIQLQNPWGDGQEWNGAFSDHSSDWDKFPELKRQLNPERRHSVRGMADGSFWMSFDDFFSTFDHIGVCPLKLPASS